LNILSITIYLITSSCGLYYKLHGSARPTSMKSDVIRKRSRHDARRSSETGLDDLPPSPGFSHRTSLPRDTSPTLAPDSTTQMSMMQRNLGARHLNLLELSVIQLQMVKAAMVTTRQMTRMDFTVPVTPIMSFSSTVCSPTLYRFQVPNRLPSRIQV
jgi:hypothetical protein